jgi:hypothetical protein
MHKPHVPTLLKGNILKEAWKNIPQETQRMKYCGKTQFLQTIASWCDKRAENNRITDYVNLIDLFIMCTYISQN